MRRDLATPAEWSPRGLYYFLRPGETSGSPVGAERVSSGAALDFPGDDPKQWRTDVPTYARVRYEAVYPGIDLKAYCLNLISSQKDLELFKVNFYFAKSKVRASPQMGARIALIGL